MRILTQNPFSVGFGGVEQQALKYIENIRNLDSSLDIQLFSWEETSFDILHIIGIHIGINPYWIDVLKNKGVIIIVSSVFYLAPGKILDFRRPIIYRMCSFMPHHICHWMKELLRKADMILPNSSDEKEQIKGIFGIKQDKIKVIYNGVDEDYFHNISSLEFSTTFNLKNYILCVSHIEPRKNHVKLIKGFLKFKQNNSSSDLKLVLLGDYRGNYFSYHKKIKNLIGRNYTDIIHINYLKNTDSIFRSAYLGAKGHILISSLETPGLSNIESAYGGKPIILGICSPVKEYFKQFGTYVNPNCINQIAKVIENLNATNYHDIEQIEFIKNNYTWEKVSKDLITIYKQYEK